jgi:hypothetical protein
MINIEQAVFVNYFPETWPKNKKNRPNQSLDGPWRWILVG